MQLLRLWMKMTKVNITINKVVGAFCPFLVFKFTNKLVTVKINIKPKTVVTISLDTNLLRNF